MNDPGNKELKIKGQIQHGVKTNVTLTESTHKISQKDCAPAKSRELAQVVTEKLNPQQFPVSTLG